MRLALVPDSFKDVKLANTRGVPEPKNCSVMKLHKAGLSASPKDKQDEEVLSEGMQHTKLCCFSCAKF